MRLGRRSECRSMSSTTVWKVLDSRADPRESGVTHLTTGHLKPGLTEIDTFHEKSL